ncbi:MAG: HNH endonuclease [Candidatus Competibacteraceae bacterium]|nr:HNH endonuclease [Candidatus Competibacteraceae bacterium]
MISYKGYTTHGSVLSENLNEVPDCLRKVPGSVGCQFSYENYAILQELVIANRKFIDYASANTTIKPKMRKAHSVGFVQYLEKITDSSIENPTYIYAPRWVKSDNNVKQIPINELKEKIASLETSQGSIRTRQLVTIIRSEYITEYAKRMANGICQDCGQPAPFVSKTDNEPFLEVHHILPLSKGGKDSIENVTALCPIVIEKDILDEVNSA